MKEQIAKVIWRKYGGDGKITETFILSTRCIEHFADGKPETFVMEEQQYAALTAEISAMITGEQPDASAEQPVRAVAKMQDGTEYNLPADRLEPLMRQAFADSRTYISKLTQTFSDVQPMGLVSCAPPPASATDTANIGRRIKQVAFCGMDGISYLVKITELPDKVSIKRTVNDSSSAAPLDDLAEGFLDDICALIQNHPDYRRPLEIVRSEITLDDGGMLYVPPAELQEIMENAWTEAKMLLDMQHGTQLQGAVMCPTALEKVTTAMGNMPPTGPMAAFFSGMNMANMSPQTVRVDNETWNCKCGAKNQHGHFCAECGSAAPPLNPWDCMNCAQTGNTGKFCINCGTPMPEKNGGKQ